MLLFLFVVYCSMFESLISEGSIVYSACEFPSCGNVLVYRHTKVHARACTYAHTYAHIRKLEQAVAFLLLFLFFSLCSRSFAIKGSTASPQSADLEKTPLHKSNMKPLLLLALLGCLGKEKLPFPSTLFHFI